MYLVIVNPYNRILRKNITFETEFLRSAVMSVAHKLFIQRYLLEKRNATN